MAHMRKTYANRDRTATMEQDQTHFSADGGGKNDHVGRPQRVSDAELIATIERLITDKNPVVSTAEIAEADGVPLAMRTVQRRLNALHEAGELHMKEVGARGRVWWPVAGKDVDEDAGDQ